MKELDSHITPKLNQDQAEIRTIPKSKEPLESFRIYPGCKLYEMILVSTNPDDPLDVIGMDRETGAVDPELAEIREARYTETTATMAEPTFNLVPGVQMILNNTEIQVIGKIKRGIRRELIYTDGNIYDVASSAPAARKKIIRKFFKPFQQL